MKLFYACFLSAFFAISIKSQVITDLKDLTQAANFNKFMDRVNNPNGSPLKYDEISGDPFFNKNFTSAKVEGATNLIPARYNTYTDMIEIMNNGEIFVLPKISAYPKITFNNPITTFILHNNEYYFLLADGKNQLLGKVKTEFRPEVKAVNTFASGTPPRFERLKPSYFIKSGDKMVKISKNSKELAENFPDQKDAINDFIKTNKIKMNEEKDLIKLVNFMNK